MSTRAYQGSATKYVDDLLICSVFAFLSNSLLLAKLGNRLVFVVLLLRLSLASHRFRYK